MSGRPVSFPVRYGRGLQRVSLYAPTTALPLVSANGPSAGFFPHPTNATTAIINRICFMPATLRLTDSGVNAVGGGSYFGSISLVLGGPSAKSEHAG